MRSWRWRSSPWQHLPYLSNHRFLFTMLCCIHASPLPSASKLVRGLEFSASCNNSSSEKSIMTGTQKVSTLVCNSQTRSFSPFFHLPERRISFSSCRQNWRREDLCGFSAFTVMLRMSGVMRRTFFLFRRGICCRGRR